MFEKLLTNLSGGVSLVSQKAIQLYLRSSDEKAFADDGWTVRQQLRKYFSVPNDAIQAESSRVFLDESKIVIVLILKNDMPEYEEIFKKIINDISELKHTVTVRLGAISYQLVPSGITNDKNGDYRSVWLRNVPSKMFQLPSTGILTEEDVLWMALSNKYGSIESMAVKKTSKELLKDVCIRFQGLSSACALLEDFSSNDTCIIASKTGLSSTFIVTADIDTTEFLSQSNVSAMSIHENEVVSLREELIKVKSESQATMKKIQDDLVKKQNNQSSYKELDNQELSRQLSDINNILLPALLSDITKSDAILKVSSDEAHHLRNLIKSMQQSSKKLFYSWHKITEDISAFIVQREKDEMLQNAERREIENIERQHVVDNLVLEAQSICKQCCEMLSKAESLFSKNTDWNLDIFASHLGFSQLRASTSTLEKLLNQRQEGSQRYVNILNKAMVIPREKLSFISTCLRPFEALALFKSFLDKSQSQRLSAITNTSVSQSSKCSAISSFNESFQSLNAGSNLVANFDKAIQFYIQSGHSYISNIVSKLNSMPSDSSSIPMFISNLMNENSMFLFAEQVDSWMVVISHASELPHLEKQVINDVLEVAEASIALPRRCSESSTSQNTLPICNSSLDRRLSDRINRFVVECVEPHKNRCISLQEILERVYKQTVSFNDTLPVYDSNLEDIKSSVKLCIDIFRRESNRLVRDIEDIAIDIAIEIEERERRTQLSQSMSEIPIAQHSSDAVAQLFDSGRWQGSSNHNGYELIRPKWLDVATKINSPELPNKLLIKSEWAYSTKPPSVQLNRPYQLAFKNIKANHQVNEIGHPGDRFAKVMLNNSDQTETERELKLKVTLSRKRKFSQTQTPTKLA